MQLPSCDLDFVAQLPKLQRDTEALGLIIYGPWEIPAFCLAFLSIRARQLRPFEALPSFVGQGVKFG